MKRLLLTLLVCLVSSPVAAQTKGYWKTFPPAPTVRTEAAVALLNDKAYLIGGFTPQGISERVDVFNVTTGTWETAPPLPRPVHHTTATVVGGKLYVIGGFSSGMWSPVNWTFEYDPGTKQWKERAPMPTQRGALGAAAINGKIYAVSGALKKLFRLVNTPVVEVFDPAKNAWSSLAPIPTARDHLTVSAYQGKLHAIGGRVNVNYHENLNAHEVYNPKTNSWKSLKALPTARSGITSQVLNGRILVFGGESGEGTFDENEAYVPETDAWETLAPMPTSRHGLGSFVVNHQLHVVTGGPNPGGGGSSTHEVFSFTPFR